MGQAQSDPGVSTKRLKKEKVKKKRSGKSLTRFLHLFSLLTCCVRPMKRKSASSAKTNDDTDSGKCLGSPWTTSCLITNKIHETALIIIIILLCSNYQKVPSQVMAVDTL